jgi:predicted Kef-type K+ transport protein
MRWVGSNTRFGGYLALFALVLQLAVSFGHVHLDDVRVARLAVTAAAGVHTAQSEPAPQPATDSDDYCAICASIFLVASSFTPQPPQLPVPFGATRVEHLFVAITDVAEPRRVAFQSRAPPTA